MDENELIRCEANDPHRCQNSGLLGQCPFKAKLGAQYCPRHNARIDETKAVEERSMYKLQQYQERVNQLSNHTDIKNLREEIGILRMTLEKIIDACHGDDKILVSFSGKIADIAVKIRTLLVTCHRLDMQLGNVMDREKIILIGQAIVELVADVVPNPEVLDDLGAKIVERIMAISVGPINNQKR